MLIAYFSKGHKSLYPYILLRFYLLVNRDFRVYYKSVFKNTDKFMCGRKHPQVGEDCALYREIIFVSAFIEKPFICSNKILFFRITFRLNEHALYGVLPSCHRPHAYVTAPVSADTSILISLTESFGSSSSLQAVNPATARNAKSSILKKFLFFILLKVLIVHYLKNYRKCKKKKNIASRTQLFLFRMSYIELLPIHNPNTKGSEFLLKLNELLSRAKIGF